MLTLKRASASSAGVAGTPTIASTFTEPSAFRGAPFASGDPIVSQDELCTGGLQDPSGLDALPGKSGGPCRRLGAVHALYAGTSGTRVGVAPFGRGYGSGFAK